MKTTTISNEATRQASEFLGNATVAYAKLGTDRHTANFYGDDAVCALHLSEIVGCVSALYEGNPEQFADEQEAIDLVLGDLTLQHPYHWQIVEAEAIWDDAISVEIDKDTPGDAWVAELPTKAKMTEWVDRFRRAGCPMVSSSSNETTKEPGERTRYWVWFVVS